MQIYMSVPTVCDSCKWIWLVSNKALGITKNKKMVMNKGLPIVHIPPPTKKQLRNKTLPMNAPMFFSFLYFQFSWNSSKGFSAKVRDNVKCITQVQHPMTSSQQIQKSKTRKQAYHYHMTALRE